MTKVVVIAENSDDDIRSSDPDLATAYDGTGTTEINANSDETITGVGQNGTSVAYYVRQLFLQYNWTPASDSVAVHGALWLYGNSTSGSGISRRLEVYRYDWGTDVDAADWRDTTWLGDSVLDESVWIAFIDDAEQMGTSTPVRLGLEDRTYLDSSGNKRLIMASSRNRGELEPNEPQYNWFRAVEYSGTDYDPRMEATFTTNSMLDKTLGAQAQLSDGTYVYLEQDDVGQSTSNYDLVYHDNSSPNVINTFSIPLDVRGAQVFSLTRDGSDNIYVFTPGFIEDHVSCLYYEKGSGANWSSPVQTDILAPTDEGSLNNLAVAWHDVGSGEGTILCMAFRSGSRGSFMNPYFLLDCDSLAAGDAGAAVKNQGRSGPGDSGLLDISSRIGYHNFLNETGSMLDICPEPDNGARGYVVGTDWGSAIGFFGEASIGRYDLNSDGDGFDDTVQQITNSHIIKDADSKTRVLGVDDSRFVVVTVSDESGTGLRVRLMNSSGTANTEEVAQSLHFDINIDSLPAAANLAQSSSWDAVYDNVENNVWVFYFDDDDEQRLIRTHVDMDTGLAAGDEFEVNNSVGASGSINHAIRLSRENRSTKDVLVSVANEDGSGTHSLIVIPTVINSPPTQPSLSETMNFDATNAQTFEWTFNDPDPGESQGWFRLQIIDDGDSTVLDTGQTESSNESYEVSGGSLSNGEDYRWRVKTWDDDEFEGPWSDYDNFSTGDTGLVNITDPGIDNDPNVITADYDVQWDLSNANQEEYRVVVERTADNEQLSDSGWVSASGAEHTVTGMDTATEYEVRVTTRESGVESNTATRLITPHYTFPERPTIAVTAESTYNRISITNPSPQGDRPHPDVNQIWRRVSGVGNRYKLVATVDPNITYLDYTVRSGESYDYFIRAGVESDG